MERTICDVMRSRRSIDAQVFYDALKLYAERDDKNLPRLVEYAKLFHVDKLVLHYMALLLPAVELRPWIDSVRLPTGSYVP